MTSAITTKFFGPTNHRGARIKASAGDLKAVTLYYNYGLGDAGNHAEAAKKLATELGWPGVYVGGTMNAGWVFVRLAMSPDGRLPALSVGDIDFIVDFPDEAKR